MPSRTEVQRELLTSPVVVDLGENRQALFQGYLHEIIKPSVTAHIRRESIGRGSCDVAFLLTARQDGTYAITLTHFLSSLPENQLAVIHAMTPAKRHGEGLRRAIYLTSNPISMDIEHREKDPAFGPIYKSLKAFNHNEEPDIIFIPEGYGTTEEQADNFQFVYEMSVDEREQTHTFAVTGTKYRRVGTVEEIIGQGTGNYSF